MGADLSVKVLFAFSNPLLRPHYITLLYYLSVFGDYNLIVPLPSSLSSLI